MTRVFVDGAVGTTGLEIRERLAGRPELTLVEVPRELRKDTAARAAALNGADLVILCLPDEAAAQAVALIENPAVRVIDASSVHRVAPGWTYGFPEMEPGQRARIAAARLVANPGCWPTGFLSLVRPLTRAGILPVAFPLTVHGVSGYSGGGRAMIEEFEQRESPTFVQTVSRIYGLSLAHKHLPEMTVHAGLTHPPVFAPSVARYYRGMIVEVPLQLWALPARPRVADLHATLADAYHGEPLVEVVGLDACAAMKGVDAEGLRLTNRLRLHVFGNEETGQARLVALLDNLGKGAAGAAVQNLNIMLGLPETAGLV